MKTTIKNTLLVAMLVLSAGSAFGATAGITATVSVPLSVTDDATKWTLPLLKNIYSDGTAASEQKFTNVNLGLLFNASANCGTGGNCAFKNTPLDAQTAGCLAIEGVAGAPYDVSIVFDSPMTGSLGDTLTINSHTVQTAFATTSCADARGAVFGALGSHSIDAGGTDYMAWKLTALNVSFDKSRAQTYTGTATYIIQYQ